MEIYNLQEFWFSKLQTCKLTRPCFINYGKFLLRLMWISFLQKHYTIRFSTVLWRINKLAFNFHLYIRISFFTILHKNSTAEFTSYIHIPYFKYARKFDSRLFLLFFVGVLRQENMKNTFGRLKFFFPILRVSILEKRIFFSKQRKTSNCFSTVYLFPL